MLRSESKMMRAGGLVLEVALGVLLVAIVISAWKTQSSYASGARPKKIKTAASAGDALLPLVGTPVFSFCLQDDAAPGNVVQFNANGAYVFCCNGSVMAQGVGQATVRGGLIQIQHNVPTYRVLIKADTTTKKGVASLQLPPGVIKCIIADRDMSNNNCVCAQQASGAESKDE